MLSQAVDSYLALRRAAGFQLRVQEALLRSFVRFASERGMIVAPPIRVQGLAR